MLRKNIDILFCFYMNKFKRIMHVFFLGQENNNNDQELVQDQDVVYLDDNSNHLDNVPKDLINQHYFFYSDLNNGEMIQKDYNFF